MSTRSSVFHATDENGNNLHVYWEYVDQRYYMDFTGADGAEYDEIEVPRRLLEALGCDSDRQDDLDPSRIKNLVRK